MSTHTRNNYRYFVRVIFSILRNVGNAQRPLFVLVKRHAAVATTFSYARSLVMRHGGDNDVILAAKSRAHSYVRTYIIHYY